MPRLLINEMALKTLSKLAGIRTTEEHEKSLVSPFNAIIQTIDMLERVDIGEVPPPRNYDPRWERTL